MRNSRQLLDAVDTLYDAVSDIDKWPAFLETAADLFSARGAQIAHHDLENNRLSFSMVHGYDWSVEHYQRYEQLMGEDPRIPPFSQNPFKAMHCRSFLTDEEIRSSRVYKEVLSVGDVEYSLGVNLVEHDRALTHFLALRSIDQPPFTEEECATLDILIPHIHRAVKLQKELGLIDFERNASVEALDSMALGIVVINAASQIQMVNETTRQMAMMSDGIQINSERLQISEESNNQFLKTLRNHFKSSKLGNDQAGEALQIIRPSGKEPYSILLSTYHAKSNRYIVSNSDEPLAILLIRDLDHPQESRTEILQRLYGLTPSQARLTNHLANGNSLKDAASKAKLTNESARQYLKLIFQKTGTNRQAELVRKVILTPKANNWGEIVS